MVARNSGKFPVLVTAIVDLIIIHLGYVITFFIRYQGVIPAENYPSYLFVAPWLSLVVLIIFHVYGLFDVVRKRWIEILYSIGLAVFLTFVSAVFISFIGRSFAFPRTVLGMAMIVHFVLLGIWRYVHWKLSRKIFGSVKVIVVGNNDTAQRMLEKLTNSFNGVLQIVGVISEDNNRGMGFDYLGGYYDFSRCIQVHNPDAVIFCSNIPLEIKKQMVSECLLRNVSVSLVPDIYEILLSNATLTQVDDVPVFNLRGNHLSQGSILFKRMLDIVVSTVVLILTAPILLLVVLLIKLDSPGPVFYVQERLSVGGRRFNLYKFRSMKVNAEELSGPVLATENDPRITRVGRIIRATRIDELPQFINVLKGEMSVIGPRPERPFFVEQFARDIPGYENRLELKAGITGLAQVFGKYSTTPEDKLKYDLLYAKAHSPIVDFQILFNTLKVMIMRDKAS